MRALNPEVLLLLVHVATHACAALEYRSECLLARSKDNSKAPGNPKSETIDVSNVPAPNGPHCHDRESHSWEWL